MKFAIDRNIRYGYFITFILLVICYLLLFSTTDKMLTQIKRVNHAAENFDHFETLRTSVNDMQTGFAGYLLLKDSSHFSLYLSGKQKIDTIIPYLTEYYTTDTVANGEISRLQFAIKQYDITLKNGLSVFVKEQLQFADTVKSCAFHSQYLFLDIRRQISSIQNKQQALIYKNETDPDRSLGAIKIINFTSLIIATLVAIYSLITYTKENNARRCADEQALKYRKQLEQRIEELNIANTELGELKSIEKFAATGRMARMIAHEVRNPLTNIGLANEQLRDSVDTNEENNMLLNMIKRNGERINALVGDLLNATKFVELNRAEYSINDLIDEVLEQARDRIALSNVTVEKNYAKDICKVTVDAEKLHIAFLNIIMNAIEAIEAGKGIVQITTLTHNNLCRVIIKDNGIGISEESLPKLFEPFFTTKDTGNGLGLTNAQNIILNHKGTITVESKPGHGTAFFVNLYFK